MNIDTELPNIKHKTLVNNPFTGENDDELNDNSEEKNLKMKKYSSQIEPS